MVALESDAVTPRRSQAELFLENDEMLPQYCDRTNDISLRVQNETWDETTSIGRQK